MSETLRDATMEAPAARLAREWFSAAELGEMKLPDLPETRQGIQLLARDRDWLRPTWQGRYWRRRAGRGGGVELHYSVLPHEAQVALALRFPPAAAKPEVAAPGDLRGGDDAEIARAEAWARYERAPASCARVAAGGACLGARCRQRCQRVAQARLGVLAAVEALEGSMGRLAAIGRVAREQGIGRATLHSWFAAVAHVARVDRLTALLPHQTGTAAVRTDMVQAAWDTLANDWLRGARASFEGCWRRLVEKARAEGWALVSKRTALRRMNALPVAVQVAGRGTKEALKALYPAQERDRSGLYAMEAVNSDAHRWDVMVLWPDGSRSRPQMEAFADLYSGKMLAWRFGKTVSAELVRQAFGDMVERYGIPRRAVMDNGREQASKQISGQIPTRYRFRPHDDDPAGVLAVMGVEVHWTTPYSGQSKPIERAFRDMAHDIARHPAFEGAYVGHNVLSKPDEHSKTVPFEVFRQVVDAEIVRWNARPGRRSRVCAGRSFDDAFAESYAAHAERIARPSEAQRRLWLLAAETATVSRRDGAIRVLGNRFWDERLHGLRGQKVVVRYDPARVQADLHVYRLDGSYVVAASCIDPVGFFDRDAAGEFNRARKQKQKAVRAQVAALRTMTAAQTAAAARAAAMDEVPPPVAPAPETRVIRATFGNTALKPVVAHEAAPESGPAIDFDANFDRKVARLRHRLRTVGDEDV